MGPPYGAYDDACSNNATFIPLACAADAAMRPANPPPAINTVNGCCAVMDRPPLEMEGEVLHQALMSSSPISIPFNFNASKDACAARERILAVRSSFSG
eukprot:scaffold20852_cov23-Cyclotella_meneghiniana.AAC.2